MLVIFACLSSFFILDSNIHSNFIISHSKSNKNRSNDLTAPRPSQSSVIVDNKTISDGYNLYEGESYWFNASVYDSAQKTKTFTNAYQETSFNGGFTTYSNDSLYCNNSQTKNYNQSPTAGPDRVIMSNGTNKGSGTFWGTPYAGHIDGTFSFTRDANGANPGGWSVSEAASTSVDVAAGSAPHIKVLYFYDAAGVGYCSATQVFSPSQASGTIEYWIMDSDIVRGFYTYIYDSTTWMIEIKIDASQFTITGASATNLFVPTNYMWYRVRFDFETGAGGYLGLAADTCNCYVYDSTGALKGSVTGKALTGNRNSATYIYFGSGSSTLTGYIDAVSYSWTTQKELKGGAYVIGDNRLPYTSDLNFSVGIPLSQYLNATRQKIALSLTTYHKTNISNYIDVSVWNFHTSKWEMFSNVSSTTYSVISWSNFSTQFSYYLNATGHIRLKYHAKTNPSADFSFSLPYLNATLYYKANFAKIKMFNSKTLWAYRYHLKGSDVYSEWVIFDVIEPIANVEMISESPYYTRWDFVKTTGLTTTDLYYNDFTTTASYWDLYGVSQRTMTITAQPTDDAYVTQSDPNANDGLGTAVFAFNNAQVQRIFIKYEYNYLDNNFTSNSKFYCYVNVIQSNPSTLYIYKTTDFSESTITWNNQPSTVGSALGTQVINSLFYQYVTLISPSKYYSLRFDTVLNQLCISSKDDYWSRRPTIYHYLAKNYQGSSKLYCQTNTTEILSLRSPALGLSLASGDQIVVAFNTTSSNRIDLNLLNAGGTTVASNILSSQGNTNYNSQTQTFSVSSALSVDKLEFTGTFADTKNLQVDSIRVYRYNSQMNTSYVNPQGLKQIYLSSANYNYSIYENGLLKQSGSITTTTNLQTIIFESVQYSNCYLNFYDSNNEYLNFNMFTVYLNYTFDETVYTNVRMSSNVISVDKNTQIYFKIYDSFNRLIRTYSTYETTFIDVTLSIYNLKLKNEAQKQTDYSLTSIESSVTKTGLLLPSEIKDYYVNSGNYSFVYTNREDGISRTVNFNLTSHMSLVVNTTYRNIYFALFSYDGLGLSKDLVRFYINGSRKDFGFNWITSQYANLTILDYFNHTLFSQIIDCSNLLEYNIYIDVYTLNVVNLFMFDDLKINITQVGSVIYMTQLIPKQFSFPYRFLPNLNYSIEVRFVNDTLYMIRTLNLTANNQIESFGVTEEYPVVPFFPADMWISLYNPSGLAITNDLRIYKNGTRIIGGLTSIETNYTNIVVMDFFNNVLYNLTVNYSKELNILINVTTVYLINNGQKGVIVKIKRSTDVNWTIEKEVSGLGVDHIELLMDIYDFRFIDKDGNQIEQDKTISVGATAIKVDFGFYSTEVPTLTTKKTIADNTIFIVMFIAFVFTIVVFSLIMLIMIKRNNRIPKEIRNKFEAKRKDAKYGASDPIYAMVKELNESRNMKE